MRFLRDRRDKVGGGKIEDRKSGGGKSKDQKVKEGKSKDHKVKEGKGKDHKMIEGKPKGRKPPAGKPKKKKDPQEERQGVYGDYMEGHPVLPKMFPLASAKERKGQENKREDVRGMKKMFDEGYNAFRLSGAKVRPKMVMLKYIFTALSILKMVGTLSFLISQILLSQLPTFSAENSSTDFFYRVMLNATNLSLAFQIWMILVDVALIQQMFKQNSKSLIWIFALSSCLSIFVLLISAFHISTFSNLTRLVSSLVGSYLASSSRPLSASSLLFSDYECCGFYSPLDWHNEKVYEWDSPIIGSSLTLQQNFSWVEECSESHNKDQYDNFLCTVPSFCPRNDLSKTIANATGYSRVDLSMLIREEGSIRSTFFQKKTIQTLHETGGCITVIVDFVEKRSIGFIIGISIMAVVLPLQSFLVSLVCVNDNGFGRLVKKDGVASMDKMENCKALTFFKKWDISMGVQAGNRQVMWTSGEE